MNFCPLPFSVVAMFVLLSWYQCEYAGASRARSAAGIPGQPGLELLEALRRQILHNVVKAHRDQLLRPPYQIRSRVAGLMHLEISAHLGEHGRRFFACLDLRVLDRKSTRLNSSHVKISYAVFCLKKKIHKEYIKLIACN